MRNEDTLETYKDHSGKTKIFLAAFALFLIFDYMTRDFLFNLSLRHAKIIRTEYATSLIDKISHVISELGDKYFVGLLIFISFHTLDQTKSFIAILAAVNGQAFSCVLKCLYHEARPFFMADYKPTSCRFEYGNPSGHSFIATGLFLPLWYLACRQYKVSKCYRLLSLVALIFVILVLGASRIYNGVHTYN